MPHWFFSKNDILPTLIFEMVIVTVVIPVIATSIGRILDLINSENGIFSEGSNFVTLL